MHRTVVLLSLCAFSLALRAQSPGTVIEYAVKYPNATSVEIGACHPAPTGSTHEIAFNPTGRRELWITGQNYDQVVRVTTDGAMTFCPMPAGSGPHGIEFDAAGRLWVTLELSGQIVRLDANGAIQQTIDVRLDCTTCPNGQKINTHPHGLWIGADGKTIWFTGKSTGTIGKVTAE